MQVPPAASPAPAGGPEKTGPIPCACPGRFRFCNRPTENVGLATDLYWPRARPMPVVSRGISLPAHRRVLPGGMGHRRRTAHRRSGWIRPDHPGVLDRAGVSATSGRVDAQCPPGRPRAIAASTSTIAAPSRLPAARPCCRRRAATSRASFCRMGAVPGDPQPLLPDRGVAAVRRRPGQRRGSRRSAGAGRTDRRARRAGRAAAAPAPRHCSPTFTATRHGRKRWCGRSRDGDDPETALAQIEAATELVRIWRPAAAPLTRAVADAFTGRFAGRGANRVALSPSVFDRAAELTGPHPLMDVPKDFAAAWERVRRAGGAASQRPIAHYLAACTFGNWTAYRRPGTALDRRLAPGLLRRAPAAARPPVRGRRPDQSSRIARVVPDGRLHHRPHRAAPSPSGARPRHWNGAPVEQIDENLCTRTIPSLRHGRHPGRRVLLDHTRARPGSSS